MKTVMKKLMSLMLVAVLLVSAVPFGASAHTVDSEAKTVTVPVTVYIDGVNKDGYNKQIVLNEGESYDLGANGLYLLSNTEGRVFDKWVTSTGKTLTADAPGSINYDTLSNPETAPYSLELWINTAAAPDPVCEHCGEAHETSACTRWNACCSTLDTHAATCSTQPCTTEGCTKNNHPATELHSNQCICGIMNPAAGSHHTNTSCSYYVAATQYAHFHYLIGNEIKKTEKVVIIDGYCTTPAEVDFAGYKFHGWNVGGIGLVDAGKTIAVTDGQQINAYYVDTNPTATYNLNVYVRRIVGNVVRDTQLLHTFAGREQNDNVLDIISNNEAMLRNKINASYSGFGWTGHVYNYYGEQVTATNSVLTTNGEKNVYLNLYGEEEDILVYVHTSSTSSYDRLIEIDGFQAGESVPYNTVLSYVKKYYSGSNLSMTMYSASGWSDKLNGKSNTDTYSVYVEDGTTKIHVVVANAYSSSSSSVADSTNPKTGDEIFMAVTAMAVSATALALVFFYNKKRAVK